MSENKSLPLGYAENLERSEHDRLKPMNQEQAKQFSDWWDERVNADRSARDMIERDTPTIQQQPASGGFVIGPEARPISGGEYILPTARAEYLRKKYGPHPLDGDAKRWYWDQQRKWEQQGQEQPMQRARLTFTDVLAFIAMGSMAAFGVAVVLLLVCLIARHAQ